MPPNNPNHWKTDPEYIDLLNFLIEKTKDVKSPLNMLELAREYKEKSGAPQAVRCLYDRITKFRSRIHEIDSIDMITKVKMLFALSAFIDDGFLKKLQIDVHVDVDEKNRITKYIAKDGSLELEGDHSVSAKNKAVNAKRQMDDFDDGSQFSTPKTPRSVKRSAVEVPNSSKRTKVKSEDHSPDDSARIPSRKPALPNPETHLLRQPKLEGDPGEAPISISGGAPRALGAPAPIRPNSEATDAYTSQIKFLEAIQSLVLNLDTPSLYAIQKKIEKKLRESSPNEKIANDEMSLAMEVLVTKIANRSVSNLSEHVESVNLKEVLCYLKAAILNSKLEGLEGLMEKMKGRIKDLTVEVKNIPVEKVTSALQFTLDFIGF